MRNLTDPISLPLSAILGYLEKVKTFALACLLSACSPIAALGAAASIGVAAYSGYAEYARATQPPKTIFDVPSNGRVHGVIYADDARIPYWCSEPKTRAKILAHCEARDARDARKLAAQAQAEEDHAAARAAQKTKAEPKAVDASSDPDEDRIRAAIEKGARAKGYTVDFDTGLLETIASVKRGETNFKALRSKLVMIHDVDMVIVHQVLSDDVLFRDQETNDVIWLSGYRSAGGQMDWIVGAELPSTDLRFVLVVGTKNYKTAAGGLKQAIVVRPVF